MAKHAVNAWWEAAKAKRRADTTKATIEEEDGDEELGAPIAPIAPVRARSRCGTRTASIPAAVSHVQESATNMSEQEVPGPVTDASRPIRKASWEVRKLLQEICLDENGGNASEELGQTTAVEESQAEASFADEDDNDEEDLYDEMAAVSDPDELPELSIDQNAWRLEELTKRARAVPAPKKANPKAQAPKDLGSDESSDEEPSFTFNLEILSREKHRRVLHSTTSSITLHELRQKIASSLDLFPDSLQPQYRFSTDTKDTIPCDLTTHVQLTTLLRLLRERCVPPKLANGKQSTRKMKAFSLQLFNKGDSPFGPSEAKSGASGKSKTSPTEQTKTANDIFHEKRIAARLALTIEWTCKEHIDKADKPMLCYKNPVTGLCHPITENNLNLWATLHIKDPKVYPIKEKPTEVNVLGNSPRRRIPTQAQPSGNHDQVAFPYGCYPLPYMTPALYYGGMSFPAAAPGFSGFGQPPAAMPAPAGLVMPQVNPTHAKPAPVGPVIFPKIVDWLTYCDQRPDRSGANLSALIAKFQTLGFRTINQLVSNRMTVEKLSEWLSVGPGIADLMIGFAEEDCQLVSAGKFEMELPSGLVTDVAE